MNQEDFGMEFEEAIAIVGMAGRFPGAANIAEFWRNLCEGRESITFFERQSLLSRGVPREMVDDPRYVNANGRLEGVELFDAGFFGIPPREAEVMDPQHRIFLECAQEALENSGYDPDTFNGQIGVFAGTGLSTYLLNYLCRHDELVTSLGPLQLLLGNNKDYLPLRVSYKLNLKGPSVNINTACSTSLVAVHFACQNLLDHECDMALAGGIGIQVPQDQGYLYSQNGIGSPDGHCRAFDRAAQGTVSGNGGGIVVLRRLSDAQRDGDCIHAIILATAINNDGARKVGFTAPSIEGQAAVVAQALSLADVPADSIGYVETHGTGTPLGDRIEIAALTQAFRGSTDKSGFCSIGSVKTNIGHLDEGAGIAGLIKAVLCVRHGMLPPSLHCSEPNPELNLTESPFLVQQTLRPWSSGHWPRRAGVSSFGLGGTNAHVIIQEAQETPGHSVSRPWHLLTISAKTERALATSSRNLADHLRANPELNLADVSYTLLAGRQSMPYRHFIACQNILEGARALEGIPKVRAVSDKPRSVAFLFPGQGSQYLNMGFGLYGSEPIFKFWVDQCSELLIPKIGLDLREILYPGTNSELQTLTLQRTEFAQPALFVIEYALSRLWIEFGVEPDFMLGHSLGEYVAACISGVFSLEDALALVAARGRLMQEMPPGEMLAVELSESALSGYLSDDIELSATNAPSLCVVSGTREHLEILSRSLGEQGVVYHPLRTSHAFHSRHMEPMLGAFLECLHGVELRVPQIPFLSNLTGDWVRPEQATAPEYWQQHLRHTVRFSEGLERLFDNPDTLFLEVGPGRSLVGLCERHPSGNRREFSQSLPHPRDTRSDSQVLMESAGRLWALGACKVLRDIFPPGTRRRLELPTYPFERARYWIETAVQASGNPEPEKVTAGLDHWFLQPYWKLGKDIQQSSRLTPGIHCLAFIEEGDTSSQELLGRLREIGFRVFSVVPGDRFSQSEGDEFVIDPSRPDDYEKLAAAVLARYGKLPRIIVHAWNLFRDVRDHDWIRLQEIGFLSLMYLAKSVGAKLVDRLDLLVLSNHMQRVNGDTPNRPVTATLLGAVRVIPIEYPQISCRSIDVALPEDEDTWLYQVSGSILLEDSNQVTAIRGREIWTQDFRSTPLPAGEGTPPILRKGGTYLVTGGFGSMGQAFSRYLAKAVSANLILVGRRGLPPESEWAACLKESDTGFVGVDASVLATLDLAESRERLRGCVNRTAEMVSVRKVDAEPHLQQLLNAICSQLTLRYLDQFGIFSESAKCIGYEELLKKLRVLPKFERFLDFLLHGLEADGIVKFHNGYLEFFECYSFDNLEVSRRAIVSEFREFEGLVRFLEHCASHYAQALAGEIPSISVIYPDGAPTLMDECGRSTPTYSGDQIFLRALADFLPQVLANSGERKLKVLEIGGGSGGLTVHLAQALRGLPVEYYFTDVGRSIVLRAQGEAQAQGLDFMHFATLDISKDPSEQGFSSQTFDLIVGYNVVHAAPEIGQALTYLSELLALGGLLALVETTRLRRFDEMVWGLTEGWWHFTDTNLRKSSPLLDLDQWEYALREAGFNGISCLSNDDSDGSTADTGLIMAQKQHDCELDDMRGVRDAIRSVQECRSHGSEVLCIAADVSDFQDLQTVFELAKRRFGALHGVIHTAGRLGQGGMHSKHAGQALDVLAPKVAGTINLGRLLLEQEVEPDFLLLCSSLASVVPDFGQADYCAANVFLDAYAVAGLGSMKVTAVNWGFWQELGMIGQAHLPDEWKRAIAKDIVSQGLSGAGIEVFRRILAHGLVSQVLVAPSGLRPAMRAGLENPPGASESGARREQPARRHVWFRNRIDFGKKIEAWVAHLSPTSHWVLDEHRPLGKAVLPGTAFLEMAYGAAQAKWPGEAIELSDVYFLTPLQLEDGESREVLVVVANKATGTDFCIISKIGHDSWLEHARGEMRSLNGSAPAGGGLPTKDELRRWKTIDCDGDDAFARRVSAFTPHWRCFRRVSLADDQALASLHMRSDFAREIEALPLHPSTLDMATGFMAMLDEFEQGAPFAYGRVRIWRPLVADLVSLATRAPVTADNERAYDIRICDGTGELLQEVEGFRLRDYRAPEGPVPDKVETTSNCYVVIDQPGSLGTLAVHPAPRAVPGPSQVEIEVEAAGLNFIEVLYALGLLPEPPGSGRIRFGLECAGRVSALGSDVNGLAVGDRVYGLVQPCFSRYAVADTRALAKMPTWMGCSEAAALPAAYATAYYALVTRARLGPGEKVLIHAAAGGVGMAAVHVAAWRGAKVFATAGSPEKRAYLMKLGVSAVWNSRTLDFTKEVLAATKGEGVDVVLNSLGGEFIPAGLSVLARHGRFLELGKRDIFADRRLEMSPFERHLSFMAIDVGTDLPDFDSVWRMVTGLIHRQKLPVLPFTEFSLDRVQDAFEFMAQARHIGKVVLRVAGAELPKPASGAKWQSLDSILARWRTAVSSGLAAGSPLFPDNAYRRPDMATPYRPAGSQEERVVLEIWEDLLGVSGIGIDDDFFELRGDSLLAAQVTSRLYQSFQVKLPLSSVFEYPTIAGLAARVIQLRRSAYDLTKAPATALAEDEVEQEI